MIKSYLFDWGDTLMVDFPNMSGKMCTWHTVEAVTGAKDTLAALSNNAKIYIATGAEDSSEADIKQAFERVGLHEFISGYFCKANVGIGKGTSEFFDIILKRIKMPATNVAMVGDNFDKDIKPALAVGIQPFWLNHAHNNNAKHSNSANNISTNNISTNNSNGDIQLAVPDNVKVITALSDLIYR